MVILPIQRLADVTLASSNQICGLCNYKAPQPHDGFWWFEVITTLIVFWGGLFWWGHWARAKQKREAEERAKRPYRPGRGPYLPTHYHHRHRRW